jgi:signal transduction histidine kinase
MKKSINFILLYCGINCLLYILIFYSVSTIEREQKDKVADTVTSIIRENFLMTQYRSVAKDLEKIINNNFSEIIISNREGIEVTKIRKYNNSFNFKIRKNIWSDKEQLHLKGWVLFYYDFAHLFWISFKALLASMLITLPLFVLIIKIIKKHQIQIIENEKIKVISKHKRQLSHDIRSPLATLRHVAEGNNIINNDDLFIFNKALERINYLTNIHLQDSRNTKLQNPITTDLKVLILEIIDEKELELPDAKIKHNLSSSLISCIPSELKTILSNLINNSYESMENRIKEIFISIAIFEKHCEFTIEDKGIGIPKIILNKLGIEEVSTKKNGNGLGLLHAIEKLNNWNSSLEVEKSDFNGTIIKIKFATVKKLYILVDNDELTRLTWTARAKKNGIEFYSYSSFEKFKMEYSKFPKDSVIYIDSDLGENELRGELIAKILNKQGFNNISMATGCSTESFIELTFL